MILKRLSEAEQTTLTSYSSHCERVRDYGRSLSSDDNAYLEVTHQLVTEIGFPPSWQADLEYQTKTVMRNLIVEEIETGHTIATTILASE
jgi:hypothetical protein